MKKANISFSAFTDVNFRKKAELIYLSLDGNEFFTNLMPTLEILQASISNYNLALAAAAHSDRVAVAEKNRCRRELDALLRQLGMSVMTQANGQESVLVSSGFTLNKTPESRFITNPGNVILTKGITSGQMISTVKAVNGGISYLHEICDALPTEETKWTSHSSSTCNFVFTNLTPGKQYWVKVGVIGARGQKAFSNIATWHAQ